MKEGPQLNHRVLDRSSGEDETMLSGQLPDGLGCLGFCVLDDMAFVQHQVVPRQPTQELYIVPDNIVGGDNDTVSQHLWSQANPENENLEKLIKLLVFVMLNFCQV